MNRYYVDVVMTVSGYLEIVAENEEEARELAEETSAGELLDELDYVDVEITDVFEADELDRDELDDEDEEDTESN